MKLSRLASYWLAEIILLKVQVLSLSLFLAPQTSRFSDKHRNHKLSNFSLSFNRLLDPQTNTEIANYPIYKILFCVRGHDGTPESDCFAFTESHYNAELFRIHVFRCEIQEAVSWIFLSNNYYVNVKVITEIEQNYVRHFRSNSIHDFLFLLYPKLR